MTVEHEPQGRQYRKRNPRTLVIAGPILATLAVLGCRSSGVAENPEPTHCPIVDPTGRFYENELIVGAKSEEISEDVQEIFSDFEAQVIRTRSDGKSVWVEVDPEKRDELEKVLDEHPDVEYAEKSFVIKTQQDPCP